MLPETTKERQGHYTCPGTRVIRPMVSAKQTDVLFAVATARDLASFLTERARGTAHSSRRPNAVAQRMRGMRSETRDRPYQALQSFVLKKYKDVDEYSGYLELLAKPLHKRSIMGKSQFMGLLTIYSHLSMP